MHEARYPESREDISEASYHSGGLHILAGISEREATIFVYHGEEIPVSARGRDRTFKVDTQSVERFGCFDERGVIWSEKPWFDLRTRPALSNSAFHIIERKREVACFHEVVKADDTWVHQLLV